MADNTPCTSASAVDGDVPISLNEYIEAECQLEDDARAVLGGSDTQNCTYSQGYVQRQALYACATCTTADMEPAGICLACGLDCHDGHDLYELYTKRHFRCDCGNGKFEMKCKLQPDRDATNAENKYNHNFRGVYCSCHRPYPDPEHQDDGEMIQCCVCEDWYHDNHLDLGDVAAATEYEEMICIQCVKQNPFLLNYGHSQAPDAVSSTDEKGDVDITSSTDKSSAESSLIKNEPSDSKQGEPSDSKQGTEVSETSCPQTTSNSETTSSCLQLVSDNSSQDTSSSLLLKSEDSLKEDCSSVCDEKVCPKLQTHAATFRRPKTLFMLSGWRQELCTCSQCAQQYKTTGLEFLTDTADPTHVYEQQSKNADGQTTSYEKGMTALSQLDRVQQIELLSGYNDMKSNLADFLKKFATNSKVVRAEDIQEFFEDFTKNKKRKLAVPPSSCS